jgi:hypothetical protein
MAEPSADPTTPRARTAITHTCRKIRKAIGRRNALPPAFVKAVFHNFTDAGIAMDDAVISNQSDMLRFTAPGHKIEIGNFCFSTGMEMNQRLKASRMRRLSGIIE